MTFKQKKHRLKLLIEQRRDKYLNGKARISAMKKPIHDDHYFEFLHQLKDN